ncbi:MAG: aminotransferase class I/II-fold pyridoxal phosphate-dependent enzyme [Anaerolineae bacterium]
MTAQRLAPFGTSVFSAITALAERHGAINLAQGFPDFDGPAAVIEAAAAAMRAGQNQYARSMGLPALVRAIAAFYERHYGLDFDPLAEVAVTCGATEGIAAALLGLLDPGDEVIVLEPTYDSYAACLAMAGARPRYVTLRFPDFALDPAALRAAAGPRCRAVLLNSPHNPTGKVLDDAELALIAELCQERDLIAITDEVYEHLTYDGGRHRPLASLPGMRQRTLTLSSAGKTLALTGWKVGWAVGPPPLVQGLQAAHQFLTFCAATPLQAAVAFALDGLDGAALDRLRADYQLRRDCLCDGLERAGLRVARPQGTYFVLADFSGLSHEDDQAYVARLMAERGVAAIPPSVFYPEHPDEGRRLLRFAFCKRMATLEQAIDRLSGSGAMS